MTIPAPQKLVNCICTDYDELMKNFTVILNLLFSMLFLTSNVWALSETHNTADLVPTDRPRVLFAPQIITSDGSGVNFLGHADIGYNDHSDLRLSLGLGETDFSFSGKFKWAPIPDAGQQPAMALILGSTYASDNGSNQLHLQATPLISKKFNSDHGLLNPYVALPLALVFQEGNDPLATQLTIGTEWTPKNLQYPWSFLAEIGFDLNESFTYISAAWTFQIEHINIIRRDR